MSEASRATASTATACPSHEGSSGWVEALIANLARRKPPLVLGYALTILTVLACAVIELILPMRTVPFLLFVPAIFVTSLTLGLPEGLVATVLSAALANYFFLGVTRGVAVSPPELVTTFLFLIFSSFIVIVSDAVRRTSLDQATQIARFRALQAAAEASARALRASEDALRRMNETLEHQVQVRTAELDRAREALGHAQKMEALGELTGGIAHDFSNLLTGVVGGLDLAKTRLSKARVTKAEIDEVRNYVEIALDFGGRAGALTRRLLAFARRESLGLTRIDLERLVVGLEGPIRRAVGSEVCVALEGIEGLWPVRADASEVENALLNLALNARDAMPHGGRLTLRGENVSLDRGAADALALPPGDFAILSTCDTGEGMAPDVAARAFEPFFTTKPPGKGTGLGLSMIYRFARTCGGHAAIDTRPGEGTVISIYLPRDLETAAAPL